jgi:endonuclease/exonuclease/phosphatase family metal-dependent hydrolase
MQFQYTASKFASLLILSVALLPASDTMNEIRRGNFARQAPALAELKVLDWNIDRGTQLEKIASGMVSQQPDLAILQEVDLNARRSGSQDIAQELAKRLNLNYVFATEFQELGQSSSGEPAYHGQAILTSLPIRSARMMRFESQSGFWKPHSYLPKWGLFQRRLGGRLALIAELEYRGHVLVVYDLHLESRSAGDIQYEQLKEVLADADHYPKDTPIVVAGDLNTKYRQSQTTIVQELTKRGYADAFEGRNERTHYFIGSVDYIFARGPIRIAEAKVHRDMHGSDHFPISARLVPPQQVATR